MSGGKETEQQFEVESEDKKKEMTMIHLVGCGGGRS